MFEWRCQGDMVNRLQLLEADRQLEIGDCCKQTCGA